MALERRGRRGRRWVVAVVGKWDRLPAVRIRALAFSALLAVALTAAPRGQASTEPILTRIRLTLETTSDWATATFLGGRLIGAVPGSAPPGAEIVHSGRAFGLRTTQPVAATTATLDLVIDLGPNAEPALRLRKGDLGWAKVTVQRMNGADQAVVTVVRNERPDGNAVEPRIAAAALAGTGLTLPRVDDRRLVFAFYYPWFKDDSFQGGAWTDTPSTPWATDEPAAVADMVRLAKDAGVNGFVASWNGTDTVAPRFELLLDTAEAAGGFHVAPYLELLGEEHQSTEAIVDSARRALAYAARPPFLHVGGRPVMFVYGSWTLDAVRWTAIRQRLAAAGLDPFFVGDSADAAYGFDGYHVYNPNRYEPAELRDLNRRMMLDLRVPTELRPEVPQRLWAATVSPGQNNLARNPVGGRYRSRDGGLRYDRTWSAAIASEPDWVLVTSWNEWYEATHVAPGQSTGRRALDQTRQWSERFALTSPLTDSPPE